MARKKREWIENSYYHITSRGNHRNDLFRDEADFGTYLDLLKFSLEHFKEANYQLACYCLMDNHVHLLIRCSTLPPGRLMSKLHWHYAKYFNKKYNYIGHLFQERYFSEIICDDTQLLETSRYIHLNPVRAGMVPLPEEYVYSSYRCFIGLDKNDLITCATILNYFAGEGHSNYQSFVMQKVKLISGGK